LGSLIDRGVERRELGRRPLDHPSEVFAELRVDRVVGSIASSVSSNTERALMQARRL